MRIVFRTDASILIGTGHVMRCLTLADELTRQGHECCFVCREHLGHLADLIITKGHGLKLLPVHIDHQPQYEYTKADNYELWLGVPWQEDARQTLRVIESLEADWLVVDHYALDAAWEHAIAKADACIMVIDDLANRPHECTLLLDQNLGREASDYDGLVKAECQRLIGPSYALLRQEFPRFRKQSLKRRERPKLKRILISLGGVDATNETAGVLEALAESEMPDSVELDIILGATSPHTDSIHQRVVDLPFKTTVSVNVKNMAERMCMADLSIGAVGSTSWERCCLGLPAVLMVLAENQQAAAEALQSSGAVIITNNGIGLRTELNKLVSPNAGESILNTMVKLSSELVQGDGCLKVINELTSRGREL